VSSDKKAHKKVVEVSIYKYTSRKFYNLLKLGVFFEA